MTAGVSASSPMDVNSSDENANPSAVRRTRRKGKKDDIITLFEKLSNDISNKLSSVTFDIGNKISGIQDDINNIIKKDLDTIKSEILTINYKQSQFFDDLVNVKSSLELLIKGHDDLNDRVTKVTASTSSNAQECSALQAEIAKLQHESNAQQQRERSNNLEIMGVPDKMNENLHTYVEKIAHFAGVQLNSQDIIYVIRIQPRNANTGRPKNIIAKFNSKMLRDSILSGIRKKKGLTTADIGISGSLHRIYLNEHLTLSNKILYKTTRETAKVKKFQYTWIRDGKIFVRKNDTSPPIFIKDSTRLNEII